MTGRWRLEEHAIALHIENPQTEAMARKVTVLEKGPPHPNSAPARAHELESRGRFFSTAASSSARICAKGGNSAADGPPKGFRDGPYEEIHRRIALHRAHQRLRRGTRAIGSPAGNRNASDVAAGRGEGGCRGQHKSFGQRHRGGARRLGSLILIAAVPVQPETARLARRLSRFGQGGPAGVNFRTCFYLRFTLHSAQPDFRGRLLCRGGDSHRSGWSGTGQGWHEWRFVVDLKWRW